MEIHTLDLHFQRQPNTIASFLVIGPSGPVLVETGPMSTLATLREQLASLGYRPADIRHVLVTHIHLDHAGAAGWWAQQGARIYVHQVGAPHLVDPSRLLHSATRIYGDQMDSLWGQNLAAPAQQVVSVLDGQIIDVAGLSFVAIDTPGHASHHHVYQLGNIAFAGDAAGIRIPGIFFVDLPAPPPEFKLEVWLNSIKLLLDQPFEALYLTHFGRLDDWREQLEVLSGLMQVATDFVWVRMNAGLERDQILDDYRAWFNARAQAGGMAAATFDQYEAANPLYMSVDGIIRYWTKKARDGENQ
ncbi:MAG TPA: MBL fold metallo-hydrolase [Anaerolineae bacterium]|jgi:glyoxylase-like metal-dependent hydrolase (beta-lactamase superfamily II)|nr:MBL fold metallo-hydrolase [Anaerolineae bacterium]